MRTFKQLSGLALAIAVGLGALTAAGAARAAMTQFSSPEEALRQGVSAYTGGYYEIAIPALEHAAAKNLFLGQYFLAKLYADNNSAHTDHTKAYVLFQKIANEHADADPEDDQRAPYVARSLTALAGYVRLGLPEIGLKADADRAAEYLHHAAIFFNNEDAQFELAKLQLRGEGVRLDVPRGKHWLSILSQKGHAGAQAFLADLLWRAKFMSHDAVRALALISVAAKNAPPQDEVWIHDIYQNIWCGAAEGVHRQVTGMVAEWDNRYGRKPEFRDRSGLGALDTRVERTCSDGRVVPMAGQSKGLEPPAVNRPIEANAAPVAPVSASQPVSVSGAGAGAPAVGFMSGSMTGGGATSR